MIFNSHQMEKLRKKYENQEPAKLPEIVFLDRSDKLSGERQYLEDLIALVPREKQNDWLGRILKDDYVQHLGAWFEITLFGWLKDIAKVEVEPQICGKRPDFLLIIRDNKIIIEAKVFQDKTNFKNIEILEPPKPIAFFVNAEPLRNALKSKADRHRVIRENGYPYIIAIMTESIAISDEEAIEAWFGKIQWILDRNCSCVIDERIDRSGLHFFGSNICHKSISGTLFFSRRYDKILKRRALIASYIQNPYSKIQIDPSIFPVQRKFIVIEKNNSSGYKMDWK
jgi:hypothetical protein